ncbi:MAG: malic enzyme-like NAD(P)-binding protein [Candidatus Woesearchaeota archaeon]
MDYNSLSLELHKKHKGKIKIVSKVPVKTRDDLSIAYTPGVAEPCRAIAANKNDVYTYTSKGNVVGIVTDGSAVLGLGNIGPEASLPVMEGKAVLFKKFAGIDAFPIAINSQDVDEIVNAVRLTSIWLGGINLEDISAPRCFAIEKRLQEVLDIPVFHDDQHGTAIVVLAGLTNALKLAEKKLSDVKIVISGAGAAGDAIAKLLLHSGAKNIILVDRSGAIYAGRPEHMNPEKEEIARMTNPNLEKGTLSDVIKSADVFIGVSAPKLLTPDMVKSMNQKSIIFAMANPLPEIMPEDAKAAGAFIVASGRSDYPNQINNVLVFPGVFKGALKIRAKIINIEMKIAAAYALAGLVKEPTIDKIIPSPFDKGVAQTIARAVIKAAKRTKVNRI